MAALGSGRARRRTVDRPAVSAELEPWREMRPRPRVHSYLAALVALPAPDDQRATVGVEIGLVERERFTDPETSTPEHDDDPA